MKTLIGLTLVLLMSISPLQAANKACEYGKQQIVCSLPYQLDSSTQISELIAVLDFVKKGQKVVILANGVGGRVDLADNLIKHMKNSQGKVVVYLTGDVYSAHAMIFVSSPYQAQDPKSNFLVMQHLPYVKDKENCLTEAEANQHKRWMANLMRHVYTDKEIRYVTNGYDLYIMSACLFKRADANNRNLPCEVKAEKTNYIRQCKG